MAYDVVRADEATWDEREPLFGEAPRSQTSVTDGARLTLSLIHI